MNGKNIVFKFEKFKFKKVRMVIVIINKISFWIKIVIE